MATYDNKIWLLKNIRDAFIATDDTGLCEIVMAGEDFSKIFQNKALEEKKRIREGRLNQPGTSKRKDGMGDISEDEYDGEIVTQFDPYPGMDDSDDDEPVGSYVRYEDGGRLRTNTAQWLDKKEQALKKAAKIKVIKWEDSSPLTTDQITEMFSKVEVQKPEKQKSLLAEQLKNCPNLPHRQYLEYAKFDGTSQLGMMTKSFKIFMPPEKHNNYPVVVCVIASAKIKDLIGFTCYKYSIEHPEITLGSVHEYGLCIAEDDGEVDFGFPCLDANEPCAKFKFTCLGLVELKNKHPSTPPLSIKEDINILSGAYNILSKADSSGLSNQNPSLNVGENSNTSEAVLNALKVVNEEKKPGGKLDLDKIQSHILAAEAPQYKAYRVQMLKKMRRNIPVQLVVSLDRIEIEPLVANKHGFWNQKYFLHSIDSVAWCQILETSGSKTTFRIVYSQSHSTMFNRSNLGNTSFFQQNTAYQNHDFECDNDTAKEIIEKVNTILELRNSPCRREYKTAKEKKLQTRRSFQRHLS